MSFPIHFSLTLMVKERCEGQFIRTWIRKDKEDRMRRIAPGILTPPPPHSVHLSTNGKVNMLTLNWPEGKPQWHPVAEKHKPLLVFTHPVHRNELCNHVVVPVYTVLFSFKRSNKYVIIAFFCAFSEVESFWQIGYRFPLQPTLYIT